jgi:hypothetical protein
MAVFSVQLIQGRERLMLRAAPKFKLRCHALYRSFIMDALSRLGTRDNVWLWTVIQLGRRSAKGL